MRSSIPFAALAMAFLLVLTSAVSGQVASSAQSSETNAPSVVAPLSFPQQSPQIQAMVTAYQKEQRSLCQEEQALKASGASPQQLLAWHQQNASRFVAQRQKAEAMEVASTLTLRPTNTKPRIPANASSTLQNYLTGNAVLANAQAQIHNHLVQQATSSGGSSSFAQVSQLQKQETALFKRQYATQIAAQAQLSKQLSSESTPILLPVPKVVTIPPNATPQMASYLTTRNQIRRELVQVRNQYATATPAAREAALQQWRQQNATQLQQLQQEAQNLAQTSSANGN